MIKPNMRSDSPTVKAIFFFKAKLFFLISSFISCFSDSDNSCVPISSGSSNTMLSSVCLENMVPPYMLVIAYRINGEYTKR